LENDRVKLLRDMRDNAAQISEKGFKYVGLNADQLLKVGSSSNRRRRRGG